MRIAVSRNVLVVLAMFALAHAVAAQRPATTEPSWFGDHSVVVGPSTAVGQLETGAGLPFGGEFEIALQRVSAGNNGLIGLTFRAQTYSATTSISSPGAGTFSYTVRVTPVAVGAAYHFVIPEPRLDPFVGASIGYAAASYSDNSGGAATVSSGAYLMIDGGVRYFISPRTAVQAAASEGSRGDVGTVRIALMFKL